MDNGKEVETILEREQHVLTIIQEHMEKSLDSRIAYKYNMEKDYPGIQTELFQSFWDECIEKYQDEIERYCMHYDEIEHDGIDYSKSEDTASDDTSVCVPSDSEDAPEPDDGGGQVILTGPLEEFESAFSSVCDWIYQDSIPPKKCKKLYQELVEQLKKDMICPEKPLKLHFSIRKTALACLPRILDLGNQDICSILPYLMTAYVCSPSRFLYERKTLLEVAFGSTKTEIDTIQAADMRARIPKFCQIFSFSQAKLDSAFNVNHDRPRRKVGLSAYHNPGITLTPKKREVLDYIFDYWCEKIPQFALDSKIDIKIDAKLCKELFYYYMNDYSKKTAK